VKETGMPQIGVVADDLTGATTTGSILARSRARTAVFLNEKDAIRYDDMQNLDAVIVNSNSRPLSGEEAYSSVRSATLALQQMGVRYFSKRIDTTMRGRIGTEIDAMMDLLPEDTVAVVVPAMPQSRRILVGGYSIIDGVLLTRTPVAQDVRTPVDENYIPKLLSLQTRRKVGLVELEEVVSGSDSICQALRKARENRTEVIIVDAVSLEDVENIAKAVNRLGWNVLAVDPGAFTVKLAYTRGLIQKETANVPERRMESSQTVIVAAGSATPVTKRQIEKLCENPKVVRIPVDPLPLIDGNEAMEKEIVRSVSEARRFLKREQPEALVFETALHGPVLSLDEQDKARHYHPGTSARMINEGLGKITETLFSEYGDTRIAGLYCTGGDTLVSVCSHLGVDFLEMIDYVIPQSDVMRMRGKFDNMTVVGKGGLTGDEDTAVRIVHRIIDESQRPERGKTTDK
jgi:uncharacterized protein YgbK (DUF1537 family)